MKDNIENVNLSFSCQENWDSFTPNEKGRVCDKCSKTVIDFRNSTSTEFKKTINATPAGSLCGRFRLSQMTTQFAAAAMLTTALQGCQSESITPDLPALPPTENNIEFETEELGLMGDVIYLPPEDSIEQDTTREDQEVFDW